MFLPDAVLAFADSHHGLLPRHRIVPGLMTAGEFDGLAQRGRLTRRERGIYAVTGCPRFPEQDALAAQLRARPRARITGPFVLGLLGVDEFSVRDPFAVLTAPGRHLRGVDFRQWPDPLPDRARRRVGPIQVAEPGLALSHTAHLLSRRGDGPGDAATRRLRVAFHSLQWRNLLDADRLGSLLDDLPDREPGAHTLRQLLDEGAFGGESLQETDLGRLLEDLPVRVERQVWVTPSIRVDYLIPKVRIVVEYLGRVDHDGDTRREVDAARDGELRALELLPVYLRVDALRNPDRTRQRLRTIVENRAADLGIDLPA